MTDQESKRLLKIPKIPSATSNVEYKKRLQTKNDLDDDFEPFEEDEKTKNQREMEREKRQLFYKIAQLECKGYFAKRCFTMDTDIEEIEFCYEKLLQQQRRDLLVAQIRCFAQNGLKIDEKIDLEKSPLHELQIEQMRLEKLQIERDLIKNGVYVMQFLFEKYVDFKTFGKEKVNCAQCGVENYIEKSPKKVIDYGNNCYKCKERKAQIYHPMCGHISLCGECFTEIVCKRAQEAAVQKSTVEKK